jgi:two-component system, chemotaxis family, response regulator PixG
MKIFFLQIINWLIQEKLLDREGATVLIKRLMHEVLETYLLLDDAEYIFVTHDRQAYPIVHLKTLTVVKEVREKLALWKTLSPTVISPDQRPYFLSQNHAEEKLSGDQKEKLTKILRGFSFRQIATLVNKDEFKIARYLQPLIDHKIVVLRDPQSPFDRLPQLPIPQIKEELKRNVIIAQPAIQPEAQPDNQLDNRQEQATSDDAFNQIPGELKSKVQQKIVCIDDSPTILKEINRFLEEHDLLVHAVSDSSKALMEIMRIKPDIILLDVGMPAIDGYQICRLLRNHSLFKATPIVMVTGNTGLLDRGKARLAGATDYLTKPFTQAELVKMVFRYLT